MTLHTVSLSLCPFLFPLCVSSCEMFRCDASSEPSALTLTGKEWVCGRNDSLLAPHGEGLAGFRL